MAISRSCLAGLTAAMALLTPACAGAVEPVDRAKIKLPPGFPIKLYAKVPGARSLALAPGLAGLFVGTRGDTLYAVFDRDNNHSAEQVRAVSRRLNTPNGIAWHEGQLYIAE